MESKLDIANKYNYTKYKMESKLSTIFKIDWQRREQA